MTGEDRELIALIIATADMDDVGLRVLLDEYDDRAQTLIRTLLLLLVTQIMAARNSCSHHPDGTTVRHELIAELRSELGAQP